MKRKVLLTFLVLAFKPYIGTSFAWGDGDVIKTKNNIKFPGYLNAPPVINSRIYIRYSYDKCWIQRDFRQRERAHISKWSPRNG